MESRLLSGWARRLARRHSRRGALGAAGAGALGALGMRTALAQDDDLGPTTTPATGMGEDGICRLDFEATVRLGPSNEGSEPLVFRGLLAFKIGDGGGLTDGSLTTEDKTYPVRGQGSGRTMSLRIEIDEEQTFIAVGAGENSVRSCSGEYGGPGSGPIRGDLGDWIAVAAAPPATTPTPTATLAPATEIIPTPVPTEDIPVDPPEEVPTEAPCTLQCDPYLILDPSSCACYCDPSEIFCFGGLKVPNPTTCECECESYFAPCGDYCCGDGLVCIDPGSGVCDCPDGGLFCDGVGCVDWTSDENNCGTCGHVCPFAMYCSAGECKVLDLPDM